jgi:hypothetical protein
VVPVVSSPQANPAAVSESSRRGWVVVARALAITFVTLGSTYSFSLYGGFVALYPALTVDYFGGRNASGIIGFLYTGCAVGAFIGPRLAGDVFDMSGSCAMSIAIGAGTTCLAALCVFLAPEPSSFELRHARSDGSDRIGDAA